MAVRAVGQNENSSLYTIIGSTTTGLGAGYAMKWLWPLQESEKNFSKRSIYKQCFKDTNRGYVAELLKKQKRTPAQDMFVKMLDEEAKTPVKNAFYAEQIAEKVKLLGGEDSVAGKEFRSIIRYVDDIARNLARDWTVARNIQTRLSRPAIPFLVAGAGIGFLSGFAHNVFKSDINA